MNKTNNRKYLIAPSILSADFSRLADEVGEVERGGCDVIHVDVMDGLFVPNLTIGPVVVRWLRKTTKLPLDVHLMIEEPIRYVSEFRSSGADWITIHVEACKDVMKTLDAIKSTGARPGISLRPKTPVDAIRPYLNKVELILVMTVEPGFGGQSFMPEMLEKVRTLRPVFQGHISVDGGINTETIVPTRASGADIFVAGHSIFGSSDRNESIRQLRKALS